MRAWMPCCAASSWFWSRSFLSIRFAYGPEFCEAPESPRFAKRLSSSRDCARRKYEEILETVRGSAAGIGGRERLSAASGGAWPVTLRSGVEEILRAAIAREVSAGQVLLNGDTQSDSVPLVKLAHFKQTRTALVLGPTPTARPRVSNV